MSREIACLFLTIAVANFILELNFMIQVFQWLFKYMVSLLISKLIFVNYSFILKLDMYKTAENTFLYHCE